MTQPAPTQSALTPPRQKIALIVTHGQPSDPEPAARANRALADQVAALLPDWRIEAPTLAEPDGLSKALQGRKFEGGARERTALDGRTQDAAFERGARVGAALEGVALAGAAQERTAREEAASEGAAQEEVAGPGWVYPMFMADGWFTQIHLPQRLAAAGAAPGWRILAPFGLDPALPALAAQILREAGIGDTLLLAAHGSFRSEAPARVAMAMAATLQEALSLQRAEAAFIDQSPRLATVSGFPKDALCLPFFAAAGGHVTDDLPQALAEAGFAGRILPPLGLDPRVPALIAASLQREAALEDALRVDIGR